MIENNQEYVDKYHIRNCNYLCADARSIDYRKKFKEWGFPKDIDYLSLDLDPPSVTFECLKKLPLDEYRFAVITYEHDVYRADEELRKESREIFKSYGYELICPDVTWNAHMKDPFEDWYVHADLVNVNELQEIRTDKSTYWKDILCQKQEPTRKICNYIFLYMLH